MEFENLVIIIIYYIIIIIENNCFGKNWDFEYNIDSSIKFYWQNLAAEQLAGTFTFFNPKMAA